nr:hypothetical protein X990_4386 [Burkholderia pseudomallei MSHR4868]
MSRSALSSIASRRTLSMKVVTPGNNSRLSATSARTSRMKLAAKSCDACSGVNGPQFCHNSSICCSRIAASGNRP